MKKKIIIIGGGFCGFMTAVHLLRNNNGTLHLTMINAGNHPAKGIAYGTTSEKFLLNVPAAKMSAFPDDGDHFLNWLHTRHPFNLIDKEILGKMFVPRKEYGNYLEDIYNELIQQSGDALEVITDYADDINEMNNSSYEVILRSGKKITGHTVILATGNEMPGHPVMDDMSFYSSADYYNNPWNEDSYRTIDPQKNVLIVGNGLTMVDTVIGLQENHCKGTIYSLSPHGFTILPHRHAGLVYSKLVEEIKSPVTINSLFSLFHKHTKILRHFGLSAEPVVDSLRPHSQEIWKKLSLKDKQSFLKHVRHLWGVARHRLPLHIYDFIQNLRIQNKLIVHKGKLKSIQQNGSDIIVTFYDAKQHEEKQITVGRVINCTGPSLNINKSKLPLISNLVKKGMIRPDPLFLGIDTDENGNVIEQKNTVNLNIFTLGGNLRGLLWESTAVPELRVQARNLALHLSKSVASAAPALY